jgi:hypothetical protein
MVSEGATPSCSLAHAATWHPGTEVVVLVIEETVRHQLAAAAGSMT